jgi:prevent-host-death family protein
VGETAEAFSEALRPISGGVVQNVVPNGSVSETITIAEAREKLGQLVDLVEEGAEIEITRWGKPAAVLISVAALQALRQESTNGFGAAYGKFLRSTDAVRHGVGRDVIAAVRPSARRGGDE